jgi:hypothetical protein
MLVATLAFRRERYQIVPSESAYAALVVGFHA